MRNALVLHTKRHLHGPSTNWTTTIASGRNNRKRHEGMLLRLVILTSESIGNGAVSCEGMPFWVFAREERNKNEIKLRNIYLVSVKMSFLLAPFEKCMRLCAYVVTPMSFNRIRVSDANAYTHFLSVFRTCTSTYRLLLFVVLLSQLCRKFSEESRQHNKTVAALICTFGAVCMGMR